MISITPYPLCPTLPFQSHKSLTNSQTRSFKHHTLYHLKSDTHSVMSTSRTLSSKFYHKLNHLNITNFIISNLSRTLSSQRHEPYYLNSATNSIIPGTLSSQSRTQNQCDASHKTSIYQDKNRSLLQKRDSKFRAFFNRKDTQKRSFFCERAIIFGVLLHTNFCLQGGRKLSWLSIEKKAGVYVCVCVCVCLCV